MREGKPKSVVAPRIHAPFLFGHTLAYAERSTKSTCQSLLKGEAYALVYGQIFGLNFDSFERDAHHF